MKLGKLFWILQRYSAIYFLFFLIYIEYLVWFNKLSIEYFFSNIGIKLFTSIFIILACLHAFVGLWTIGTDYLTKRTMGFISKRLSNSAELIRKSYESVFFLFGFLIIFFYLRIIWI
jgi:succinate dehydrogenase / fumarate reductase membrane anchor subunit